MVVAHNRLHILCTNTHETKDSVYFIFTSLNGKNVAFAFLFFIVAIAIDGPSQPNALFPVQKEIANCKKEMKCSLCIRRGTNLIQY